MFSWVMEKHSKTIKEASFYIGDASGKAALTKSLMKAETWRTEERPQQGEECSKEGKGHR